MTFILIFITAVVSISCFRNQPLFEKLALIPYRVTHHREWYRVLSHVFVHGDYIHLAVNLLVLLSFGGYLERILKAYQQMGQISNSYLTYLLLYFGGTIAASVHDLITRRDDPYYSSIGASGAVSAVIFTTIFFNPWNKLYLFGILPIPGIVFGLMYVIYSHYMGQRGGDGINHYAHLYGALFGFVFPLLIDPHSITVFWNNLMHF